MSKLTIILRAAVLFAVVTEVMVASRRGCDRTTVYRHFGVIKSIIRDKNQTVTRALAEFPMVEYSIDLVNQWVKFHSDVAIEKSLLNIADTVPSTNYAFNETKCRSYHAEMKNKAKIYGKDLTDRVNCTATEMENQLIGASEAAGSALRDIKLLEQQARSCSASSCCGIRTRADGIQQKYLSRVNDLTCAHKNPWNHTETLIDHEYIEFTKWLTHTVENITSACLQKYL